MVTTATLLLVVEVVTSRQHSVQEFIRHQNPSGSEAVKATQTDKRFNEHGMFFKITHVVTGLVHIAPYARLRPCMATADAKEPNGRFHELLLEKQERKRSGNRKWRKVLCFFSSRTEQFSYFPLWLPTIRRLRHVSITVTAATPLMRKTNQ